MREFNELKNRTKTYYRDYFYDNNKIHEESIFDEDGDEIGISKMYSHSGKLISIIDNDKGKWVYADVNFFPFYGLLNNIKIRADSFVKAAYGESFFQRNVKWVIGTSAIYNKDESGSWNDRFKKRPNKFLMRYAVKLDAAHSYKDMIEFKLDSTGKFAPNTGIEEVYGFEKRNDSNNTFNLSYDQALEKVKQSENYKKGKNVTAFLKWDMTTKDSFYCGQFRFYVIQHTKHKRKRNVNEDRRITRTYFNVWVFNPWTGEYLGQKLMFISDFEEKEGGFTTGLEEDK